MNHLGWPILPRTPLVAEPDSIKQEPVSGFLVAGLHQHRVLGYTSRGRLSHCAHQQCVGCFHVKTDGGWFVRVQQKIEKHLSLDFFSKVLRMLDPAWDPHCLDLDGASLAVANASDNGGMESRGGGAIDLKVPGPVDAVGGFMESCHLCRTALLRDHSTHEH